MLVSLSSSGLFFFGAVVFLLGLFHSIDAQPVNPAPPGQTVANLEVKSVDHGFCLESAGKRPLPYPSTGASLPAGTLVEFEEISGTWTVEQFTIRNSVGYTNYLGYGTPLTHCTSVELTKGALVMRVDCDNGSIQYMDISMLNYNLQCTGKVSFGIWDSDLGNNNGSIKFKILATPPYWQAGAWQTNCNGQCGKMITQTRTVQCMEQVNFAAAIPIPDIYCANAGEKPATSQPFTCRC